MFEFDIAIIPAKVMRPENGNAELVCDPVRSFDAGFVVAGHIVQSIRIPLPVGSDGDFVEENQFYARAYAVNKVIVVFCGSNVSVNVNVKPFVSGKAEAKGFYCFKERKACFKVQVRGQLRTDVVIRKLSGIYAADFAATAATVEEIHKEFGRVDILVNNAGITKDTLLMRMTEEQWDAVINVNLKSVFNFTKAVSAIMLRQKSGSIISMSSVVGVSGNAGQANYAASKAGIIGFTKSVAKELGSRNIRANAVAPGFIITDMTAKLPEEVRQEWAAKIPLKRGGTPEDIAKVCVFLASDLSAYVTGQTIHVCGGMNM